MRPGRFVRDLVVDTRLTWWKCVAVRRASLNERSAEDCEHYSQLTPSTALRWADEKIMCIFAI